MFEGVVACDLAIYIKYFVKVKKFFTYSQLNRRIKQFSYHGSDATSTPSEVAEKRDKIGGKATENWSLLRLLPILIGEKITDTDDPIWQLKIQLKELVELICAPKISHSQVALLSVLIVEYLETRKEMFPDCKLKPKHHYIVHYPALILKFGPLIRLWTMSVRCCPFKNVVTVAHVIADGKCTVERGLTEKAMLFSCSSLLNFYNNSRLKQ